MNKSPTHLLQIGINTLFSYLNLNFKTNKMKKNLALFFFLSTVLIAGTAQNVHYFEDFDDGLPSGWYIEGQWVIGTPFEISPTGAFPAPTSTSGNLAGYSYMDSDTLQGKSGIITTGAIDLSGLAGPLFLKTPSFFSIFSSNSGSEKALINISTNGVDWNLLSDVHSSTEDDENYEGFLNNTADLSAYAGEVIQLQFVYENNFPFPFGGGWIFDNISIEDEPGAVDVRNYSIHAGPATLFDEAADGAEYYNQGWVFNDGIEVINSFDLSYSNGIETITGTIDNISIAPKKYFKYKSPVPILVSGNQTWTVTLNNVNGNSQPDADVEDNSMSFNLHAVSDLHPDKAVLVEEGTATWCLWCPRGTAYLEEMSARFPDHFAGIAVHIGEELDIFEPMESPIYAKGMTENLGINGLPAVAINRAIFLDPGELVNESINSMKIAPPASISLQAELMDNVLTPSIGLHFLEDVSANYSLAVIITENDVTGPWNEGYEQANGYGGSTNILGGYELLDPVIYGGLQVPYQHVARDIIGGFTGLNEIVSGNYLENDSLHYTFNTWIVPSEIDSDNLYLTGIIIDENGEILNAKSSSLNDLLNNGEILDNHNTNFDQSTVHVYPNPVDSELMIQINLEESSDLSISVYNSIGQRVKHLEHLEKSKKVEYKIDMNHYSPGYYMIQIRSNDKIYTTQVVKAIYH